MEERVKVAQVAYQNAIILAREAYDVYEKAKTALETYDKAMASALEVYKRSKASALKAYEKVIKKGDE